jgi:N-acetylglucosamine-6-sulfatase
MALAALVTLSLAGLVLTEAGLAHDGNLGVLASSSADEPAAADLADPPNVVVIVADDLDKTLVKYLPNVRSLIRGAGAELTNFYVEQSTCCTSRATLMSGRYAHNHGVIGNTWPQGGFDRWKLTGESTALPVWLQAAGYRTAMMGKYFNEYPFHPTVDISAAQMARLRSYVPPGWDDWTAAVKGNAYAQSHYRLNVNGVVDEEHRETFLDTVLGGRAVSLVNGLNDFDFASGGQFLYYSSYSPHTPYAHPAAYADMFRSVRYPRTPDFNERNVSDKFGLTRKRKLLTAAGIARIDRAYRKRIRSVQVLDRNVGALVGALAATGALSNTYIVFTSDNGYIMGGHRREIGKYNHFEQTVNVPFFVRGPGITPGTRIDDVAGNIDIAPTIAAMTGASAPADADGVSLLPRLTAGVPLARRHLLLGRDLIPTNRTASTPLDEAPEDFVLSARASRLNDFVGVVTGRFKLIRYTHIRREELYDLERDPYELRNLLAKGRTSFMAMSPKGKATVRSLRSALNRLVHCQGADCRR